MIRKLYKIHCLLGIILGAILLFMSHAHASSPQELTLLNWADYISPDLINTFQEKFNVKLQVVTYTSDDNRDQLLVSTDGGNFDVVVIDGRSIATYAKRGWLAKISEEEIPNMENILPKWRVAYEGSKEYAVPYFWGTVGIAYRSDLVKSPVTSWMDILQPAQELQGKIFMLPQRRELVDIALKGLGYSINSSDDPSAYKQAEKLLLQQKQYVKKYDVPAVNDGSALVSGEILAAATYSGDALTLKAINKNISFVIPSEGTTLWGDYLVVMAKSEKKKLAMDFINFLNESKNAAEHAEYMYYATPNSAAEKLLPKEFLNDPLIYPSNTIMQKCEIEKILPARVYKTRNTIFMEVTRDKM
ncbi:spermidine/putrescine ABC transporter substrate-binding protein [Desulfopila sp. IMCC35006]|uniref:ABC transporter substrate-binding protein n=1 Tax=Desulfopila sp. IMCC35006 TaxID=2569542 RepID=UPI0010AB6CBF|nr:spermidine/putrescine ABC transporter substrate-binding protein [Desulfopila sp. IMCC35006]TKB23110.1 spermidine/putrescine ABC transporter substrate-binding protein [Desulfopila sp. IMCC35006]